MNEKVNIEGQAWQCTSVISVLRMQRQMNPCKFKATRATQSDPVIKQYKHTRLILIQKCMYTMQGKQIYNYVNILKTRINNLTLKWQPSLKICLLQYLGNRNLGEVNQCQKAVSHNKDRNMCKGGSLQNRATTKQNRTVHTITCVYIVTTTNISTTGNRVVQGLHKYFCLNQIPTRGGCPCCYYKPDQQPMAEAATGQWRLYYCYIKLLSNPLHFTYTLVLLSFDPTRFCLQ